ncbi:MAG: TonB-dependent outer membrane protein SusC/RagA [Gemmatimonadetes bacterium]|nr:TonB-dependent outer membrane protein SusC/RagA [Gemmatimonadota bacterium]
MGRRIMLAVLTLFAAASVAQAQGTGRIIGRVTAIEGGRSLGGITVTVVGTRFGGLTDTTGRYAINEVPVGSRQVKAQGLGFTSATMPVTVAQGTAATLNFQLVAAPYQLQEVKTVGFGTQDTRTITGAVSTVTAEQIKDIPTSNAMKAIQGRIPGVEIVATSNEPGAAMQVRIRGVRSMSDTRNEPLYVVDGIPIAGGIQDFNPATIESIDVLKDAAATAIYGSRGSNGVILVTTKRGVQDGKMHSSFSADSYYGQQQAVKITQMMNMTQFVQFLRDAAAINGQDTSLAKVLQAGIATSVVPGTTTPKRLYAYQNGIETDWQRAVLRDGGQRSFQGGLTGSSPDTRYTLSGNYFGNTGLIPGQGYNRGAATASVDHTTSRLRLGLSANLSRITQDIGEGQGAFGFATAMTPFGTPFNYTTKDSAGLLDPRPDDDPLNINPLLENRSMIRQSMTNRVFGSAYAELQLAQGLTYRMNFGPDYTNNDNGCFNTAWTHNACNNANTVAPQNQGGLPAAADRTQTEFAYTLDNLLQLNRDVGSKQHFDVTLLYGIQHDRTNTNAETSTALPYTTQLWYDLGSGTPGIPTSSLAEWSLQSYMGRVNYTLLDRYTVSATVRSDGSSRLAPGHKWATFPSVGLGWQLGDEAFMKRFTFLNNLKVRGSYGTTGNTSINPYQTQGTLSGRLYSFGSAIVRGYRPGNIANPDLTWEKTDQSDVGVEWAIFNNRISGSVDGYVQNTHDLLLSRLLPVTSGFTSTLQNIGSTRNKGIEIGVSTVNLDGWHGVRWNSDFNWSTNSNEITALTSGANACVASAGGCDIGNGWFVGQPINLTGDPQRRVFFDYKYAGIWQYADSVAMKAFNATGSSFKAGDPRVADINGDGKITADDRGIIGNSYAGWTGSVSNRVVYRNFDFSGLITIKWNYLFVDGTARGYGGRYGDIADMDYWTPTNPTNRNPAPFIGEQKRNYADTRLYTDGSHWRIRNLTLGYTASSRLASRLGAASLRLYGTAQDPYIHSSYIGNDPEVAGAAPTVRTLLFGTNIVW